MKHTRRHGIQIGNTCVSLKAHLISRVRGVFASRSRLGLRAYGNYSNRRVVTCYSVGFRD